MQIRRGISVHNQLVQATSRHSNGAVSHFKREAVMSATGVITIGEGHFTLLLIIRDEK